MPDLSGHPLGILVRVNDEDFRMSLDEAGGGRMDVELSEATAEGLVLLGRQVLIPEEDDAVVDQTGVNVLEGPFVERLREIDTADHRADMGRELLRADRRWCHAGPPLAAGILCLSPALFNGRFVRRSLDDLGGLLQQGRRNGEPEGLRGLAH